MALCGMKNIDLTTNFMKILDTCFSYNQKNKRRKFSTKKKAHKERKIFYVLFEVFRMCLLFGKLEALHMK